MEYTRVNSTSSEDRLQENEYTIGDPIFYGKFTSCIGIAAYAKENQGIFGIHLVQAKEDFFSDEDAVKVAELVQRYCPVGEAVYLFGLLDFWEGLPAFATLKQLLRKAGFELCEYTMYRDREGYYETYSNRDYTVIDVRFHAN